jgi:hypothetical protein
MDGENCLQSMNDLVDQSDERDDLHCPSSPRYSPILSVITKIYSNENLSSELTMRTYRRDPV